MAIKLAVPCRGVEAALVWNISAYPACARVGGGNVAHLRIVGSTCPIMPKSRYASLPSRVRSRFPGCGSAAGPGRTQGGDAGLWAAGLEAPVDVPALSAVLQRASPGIQHRGGVPRPAPPWQHQCALTRVVEPLLQHLLQAAPHAHLHQAQVVLGGGGEGGAPPRRAAGRHVCRRQRRGLDGGRVGGAQPLPLHPLHHQHLRGRGGVEVGCAVSVWARGAPKIVGKVMMQVQRASHIRVVLHQLCLFTESVQQQALRDCTRKAIPFVLCSSRAAVPHLAGAQLSVHARHIDALGAVGAGGGEMRQYGQTRGAREPSAARAAHSPVCNGVCAPPACRAGSPLRTRIVQGTPLLRGSPAPLTSMWSYSCLKRTPLAASCR